MTSDLRRLALIAIALLGLLALAHPLIRSERGKASSSSHVNARPNVLLIISDDQRYGTMGRMPKTRSFFGKGGRFYPNAIDSSPLCCPSRAQIFSGHYAHNTHVTSNTQALRLNQAQTLHAVLHGAGYRTAIFGKFLNGWPRGKPAPDFSTSTVGYGPNKNSRMIANDAEPWMARKAKSFLRNQERDDSRPWYMVLATHAPHGPHIPARRFAHAAVGPCRLNPAQRETNLSDKPSFIRKTAAHFRKHQEKGPCEIRRLQLRQQLSVDRMVGQVTAAMRKYGETRNTLAIYISDNGYMWRDHGLYEKFAPYVPDLKVPMYVRWPGHIRRTSVDRRLVDNVDLAPTIFGAAGINPGYSLDGRSLLAKGRHPWLLSELGNTGSVRAGSGIPAYASALNKHWQYVEYYRHFSSHKVIGYELYDLKHDPFELSNKIPGGHLGNASKRVRRHVRSLHALLKRLRVCRGANCDY